MSYRTMLSGQMGQMLEFLKKRYNLVFGEKQNKQDLSSLRPHTFELSIFGLFLKNFIKLEHFLSTRQENMQQICVTHIFHVFFRCFLWSLLGPKHMTIPQKKSEIRSSKMCPYNVTMQKPWRKAMAEWFKLIYFHISKRYLVLLNAFLFLVYIC